MIGYAEIMASIDSGTWETSSLEHFPLITVYVLINWIFTSAVQLKNTSLSLSFTKIHEDRRG